MNSKFTARQHLELIATASGLPAKRVEEVLKSQVWKKQNKQIGEFSLGMKNAWE